MPEQKSETVIFNGLKFYRYPESQNLSDRKYFRAFLIRGEPCVYLHRAIWKHTNGKIPGGCEIHHIDKNTLNNDINNLECVKYSIHQSEHSKKWFENPINKTHSNKHLDEIRPLTKKWHASKEGLAWHSEHARTSVNSIPETLYVCKFCGKEYMSKEHGRNYFCSNNCKSAWRRRSGIDDEDRKCAVCGNTFKINKYSKTKTCSKKCAGKLISDARKKMFHLVSPQ